MAVDSTTCVNVNLRQGTGNGL